MKLFLILAIVSASSLSVAADTNPKGTIHLFAAVDSNDPNVGTGCKQSWGRLRELLKRTRPSINRLAIYEFQDRQAGRSDTLLFFQSPQRFHARFKSNDVLWFYYCGHGMTIPGQGHVLKMNGDRLPREELRKTMESVKTQGVLITTDACGSRAEREPNPLPPAGAEADTKRWLFLAQLLGDLHGTVDITSATGEGLAFVDMNPFDPTHLNNGQVVGSIFSESLREVLEIDPSQNDINHDGFVDWTEIFFGIRELTQKKFIVLHNRFTPQTWTNRYGATEEQIPFAYRLSKDKVPTGLPAIPAPAVASPLVQVKVVQSGGVYEYKDMEAAYYMLVRLDRALTGHQLSVSIHFRDDQGKPLASKFPQYRDADGGLAIAKTFLITQDHLETDVNHPWKLSIPFGASADGTWGHSFVVDVYDLTSNTDLYQDTLW